MSSNILVGGPCDGHAFDEPVDPLSIIVMEYGGKTCNY